MNLSRLFILRPVATTLLMVAILFAGGLAYRYFSVTPPAARATPSSITTRIAARAATA